MKSVPMYYKKSKDKELMREADETAVGSSDPLESAGNEKPESPLKPVTRLRKAGVPSRPSKG